MSVTVIPMSENDNALRVPEVVRDELREYADAHGMTYDEAVLDILPEPSNGAIIDRGPTKWVSLGDEPYERLSELTGEGVDRAEALYFYLRQARTREDHDYEVTDD